MKTVELSTIIQRLSVDHGKRIFSLRELAAFSAKSPAAVAMALLRLKRHGAVERVGSVWINIIDRPSLREVAFTLRPVSYISFESALFEKNILSQSPKGFLSVATTGRSAKVKTPLGDIEFVHLNPKLFFGFDGERIALPEKALLDLIYIRVKKGLDAIPPVNFYFSELDKARLHEFAKQFPGYVRKHFQKEAQEK